MADLREELIQHHEMWLADARESGHEDAVRFHGESVKMLRALAAQPAPDTVPLNAVRAALEAVDTGRTQIARDNLRILEIHLRANVAQPAPAGDVELPEPLCYGRDPRGFCVGYTADQLRAYGDARAAAAASRPATAVPEAMPTPMQHEYVTAQAWREAVSIQVGWNACRDAMLSAAPQPDHLADAGKMINGMTEAETSATASVAGLSAQPAAVKQDLTTAQGEESGHE